MNEWDIEFVRRMNAFFREYKAFDDPIKDLEEFWEKFKTQVIEAYDNSYKWKKFCEVVDMIDDGV